MFFLILKQTVQLAFRKGGGGLGSLAFYIIIMTLFTFALGPESMQEHAGAAMCVALLLSVITALPLFYERDFEDGMLEQYLLQPILLEAMVLAKICGQWLASVGPVLIISPLLAVMSHMSKEQTVQAMLLLLLASPTVIALGSIAAALTLGSKRGGLLPALIIMPLYMPVLIFAASAGGQDAILFLSAMAMATLPISCLISSALIKISQD